MQKSVMVHQFSQVPAADIPRSSFDRSHGLKTTFDAGRLIPIYADEALPGDTFNLSMTGFARLATPIHPIMDNMFMETFFFAVPIRLIWDNWEKFNGSQFNPGDSTDFLVPEVEPTNFALETIGDYFGIPTGVADITANALHFRAYNLIYNEWFRDENLGGSLTVNTDDGPDSATDYGSPVRRTKRHDYFTSALPWPQKDNGNPVLLPLGTSARVDIDNSAGGNLDITARGIIGGNQLAFDTSGSTAKVGAQSTGFPLFADLSSATSATINELRQAFQIQRLQERDARGGTRYTEIIKSHFGVTSPDQRLQRPEFLGGGSSMININPVQQTSSTDATTPQGNLSAFGTASLSNHGFTRSFTEHCVIIGLINVRADITYQQGLNRMWSRQTRFDYYWPALAQIGEQTILSKEIFADGTASDEDVFGYQERYAEYRYKPSLITGLFRSSAAQSLDVWHLSEEFATRPTLEATFIADNPPIDRILAVPSEPHFLFDGYFNLRCARPMPTYGVPGMIDHF